MNNKAKGLFYSPPAFRYLRIFMVNLVFEIELVTEYFYDERDETFSWWNLPKYIFSLKGISIRLKLQASITSHVFDIFYFS